MVSCCTKNQQRRNQYLMMEGQNVTDKAGDQEHAEQAPPSAFKEPRATTAQLSEETIADNPERHTTYTEPTEVTLAVACRSKEKAKACFTKGRHRYLFLSQMSTPLQKSMISVPTSMTGWPKHRKPWCNYPLCTRFKAKFPRSRW